MSNLTDYLEHELWDLVEQCKDSKKLLEPNGFMRDMSQQDWRFISI